MIKHNNQISAKQLAKELNVSDRTIERDIEKLKKKGKLDRIGPEKRIVARDRKKIVVRDEGGTKPNLHQQLC